MKYILLLIISFATLISVKAQEIKINKRSPLIYKTTPITVIDTASVRVIYRQIIVNDTISWNEKTNHVMLLQVGNNIIKYSDMYALIKDSLRSEYIKQKMDINEILSKLAIYKGTLKECIYMNYPIDKTTTTNYFSGNFFSSEENLVKPKWTLEADVLDVLGYKCKKASTVLFGRKYTAWYAPQIPISGGPWKFSGLPGIILKVEDERKQISFTCIGIEHPKWIDQIYSPKADYIKLKKSTYLNTYKKYRINPIAYVQGTGAVQLFDLPPEKLKDRPYNPIEIAD